MVGMRIRDIKTALAAPVHLKCCWVIVLLFASGRPSSECNSKTMEANGTFSLGAHFFR